MSIAVIDAQAVAQVIKDGKYCGYPDKQVEVLSDANATRAGTVGALDRLG